MSYEEKGTWAYLVTSVGVFVGYLLWLVARADGAPLDEQPYVRPMLWAIGISILANVVGRVLFEIARPSETTSGDVRDRDIDRFGNLIGGLVLSMLVAGVLGLVMVETTHFWLAHAIYAAFIVQVVITSVVKLVAYRRGL